MRFWVLRLGDVPLPTEWVKITDIRSVQDLQERFEKVHDRCGIIEIRPGAWIETTGSDFVFLASDQDPNEEVEP